MMTTCTHYLTQHSHGDNLYTLPDTTQPWWQLVHITWHITQPWWQLVHITWHNTTMIICAHYLTQHSHGDNLYVLPDTTQPWWHLYTLPDTQHSHGDNLYILPDTTQPWWQLVYITQHTTQPWCDNLYTLPDTQQPWWQLVHITWHATQLWHHNPRSHCVPTLPCCVRFYPVNVWDVLSHYNCLALTSGRVGELECIRLEWVVSHHHHPSHDGIHFTGVGFEL